MLGLALEGGGAKGAFHIGAVKALYEQGYEFDGICGTSIGAFNGCALVQGDFDVCYKFWTEIDTSMLFDIDSSDFIALMNNKRDLKTLRHAYTQIKEIIRNKGIDTQKFKDLIYPMVNEEKLRASNIEFGIVTISLTDLKPIELYKNQIPVGKLKEYLMASANFPLFKITPLEGKVYLDGAFYDNCPVNMLVRKNYTKIFVIRTLASGVIRKVEDSNVEIINILPSKRLGNLLNFEHDHIIENIQMGYCDTMRVIKDIQGTKYYLENVYDEKKLLASLLAIPHDVTYEIGAMMKQCKVNSHRMLFEKILPIIAIRLGLKGAWEYSDLIIRMLEQVATFRGVELYKIWDFETFTHEIESKKSSNEIGKDVYESSIILLCNEIIKGLK